MVVDDLRRPSLSGLRRRSWQISRYPFICHFFTFHIFMLVIIGDKYQHEDARNNKKKMLRNNNSEISGKKCFKIVIKVEKEGAN